MNGSDKNHDDDDEIVDVEGDDDDADVHSGGTDDRSDTDSDPDDHSNRTTAADSRRERTNHHNDHRSTRAAGVRVRRSARKSTPVLRKAPTSRHPLAHATTDVVVAAGDAAPRKRGRPPRVHKELAPNGDALNAAQASSSNDHATSPLQVSDLDQKTKRARTTTTTTTTRPRTRRANDEPSNNKRAVAAAVGTRKRRTSVNDEEDDDDVDEDIDINDEDDDVIDEFDDVDDDDARDDDVDDDDESVKVHLKKSLRSAANTGATSAPATRSLRGNASHAKADDASHTPSRGSQRGTRSGSGAAAAAAAASAAAASSTTATTNADKDAIVSRTRSARGTLPNGVHQSHNGDAHAQRAFVTQDSGPMASRINALPNGLVDARMYELNLSEIDMERRVHLSRGAVSDVYKVRWCGVSAVLKEWHPSCDAQRFKNEVDITRLCQFPRVVQLYGASLTHKVMLFERLGRGNLRQVLTSEKYTLASIERHLRTWALEVAEAMAFVHANGVIHYDLKSQNVLVTMSWNTRLCDFSHSVYVGTTAGGGGGGGESEWGQIGSLEITAPEVFTQRQRTPKSDVYSFGLLLWEMLSYGETPFLQYSTDARALQTYVCAPVNGRPPLKSTWDPRVKDIMRRAWHLDPNQRPSFAQLITMLSSSVRATSSSNNRD
jgi:hypothetical protein